MYCRRKGKAAAALSVQVASQPHMGHGWPSLALARYLAIDCHCRLPAYLPGSRLVLGKMTTPRPSSCQSSRRHNTLVRLPDTMEALHAATSRRTNRAVACANGVDNEDRDGDWGVEHPPNAQRLAPSRSLLHVDGVARGLSLAEFASSVCSSHLEFIPIDRFARGLPNQLDQAIGDFAEICSQTAACTTAISRATTWATWPYLQGGLTWRPTLGKPPLCQTAGIRPLQLLRWTPLCRTTTTPSRTAFLLDVEAHD